MKSQHTNEQLASKLLKRIMLLLIVMVMILLPLSGKVRSAKSRVLQVPDDIVTTRKANFQAGDFLNTPLVSITLQNNATPTYLLMVLNFDFGGDWDSEYAEVKLVWALGANESITFTNEDMISYISNIKAKSYSASLKTKLGVSSLSELQSDISKLMSIALPEGTHTVTLKAYDIASAEIPSTLPAVLKEQSVSFNVVTIGSISVMETPTVDNLNLTFQVPEIPVYAPSVQSTVSSTKVRITGPGVDETLSKNHTASVAGTASYKGYPGDLKSKDGQVTFNLEDVPFRAGEQYAATITFLDWNNAEITSKTVDFTSFSTPKLYMNASLASPFTPVFSWGFTGTDYADWVKEYRIYLNGSYYGYTASDSYEARAPLAPNTTYTWYAMPIHQDGTPFFSSSGSLAQTFTTKTHTGLTVQAETPANNGILLIDETYDFSGTATFTDGAELKTASWKIGTETKSGIVTTFKPTKRYVSGALTAVATVTDTLGLSKSSDTLRLTVLDPAVAISGGTTRTVNKGVKSTFSIDTGTSRDIASYEWFVDGSSVGSGAQLPFTFDESGTHTVSVSGTTVADVSGNKRTVTSSEVSVTVIGQGPTVAITQPTASVEMIVNSSLNILSDITYDNPIASTTWTITGNDTSQSGTTGTQLSFLPTRPGEYTITVTVQDIHGKSATTSTRVLVIDPTIKITNPGTNAVFSLGSTLTPTIEAPNADRVSWSIGTTTVTGSSQVLASLGTGRFDLQAEGTWNVVDAQGRPMEYTRESEKIAIQVKDLAPPVITMQFPNEETVFKAGTTYRLRAEASSASALASSWWEADGIRLTSNSYVPSASTTEKLVKISYHATNADGISSSQSVSVRKITPSVVLTTPSVKEYLSGTAIPISATAVDSTLFWLVDGTELSTWDKQFRATGTHVVRAGWRASASDASGNSQEYSGLSEETRFSIFSTNPPRFESTTPETTVLQGVVGQTFGFSVSTSSDNPLQQVAWSEYLGTSRLERAGVVYAGNSFSAQYTSPGLYTVKAKAVDTFGYSATKEWTVKIIDPTPVITYPESGMVFGRGSVPAPVISQQGSSSIRLIVDGRPVGDEFDWNTLSLGIHTIVAEGTYVIAGQTGTANSTPVNFTIENRTPPEFYLSKIQQGDRLISDQVYTVEATQNTAVTRPTVDSFTWFLDGSQVFATKDPSGVGERYTLQQHTEPSDPIRRQTITVRGTLGGISEDKSATFSVINPTVKAKLPAELMKGNAQFPAGTVIPLLYEGTHIDRIEWFVDGTLHQSPTVSFTEPGMHSIALNAYATNVRMPNTDRTDYLVGSARGLSNSFNVEFEIIGKSTISSLEIPTATYSNRSIPVSVAIDQGTDYLVSIAYRVDGTLVKESKAPVETRLDLPALGAGTHLLQVTITDKFGNSSSKEQSFIVHDPLTIGLKQPAKGAKLAPNIPIIGEVSILGGSYKQVSWSVDGVRLSGTNFLSGSLGRLPSGVHVIEVQVQDMLNNSVSASTTVEVESDLRLSLIAPAGPIDIVGGAKITCMANVEKVAGSTINLADAANYIMWYVNGSPTGATGLSYQFDRNTPGIYTVQARYAKGTIVRNTAEQTISVREMVPPSIMSPLNGSSVPYSPGETIRLSATGETGALHAWELDGKKIASSLDATFNPEGLSGTHQLRLTSTLHGTTIERLVTFTLVPNTPPSIELTSPAKQYTNAELNWNVVAFDVEDGGVPTVELFWDGISLGGTPKLLESSDIGTHTLMAQATDSKGITSTKQRIVTVEPDSVEMMIQSPSEGGTYYRDRDIELQAAIADATISAGTYLWTVQYLDDPMADPESYAGSTTTFRPTTTGEVAIIARNFDPDGRERGNGRLSINVATEPAQTELYWPHGAIVHAGSSLTPELIKLPESALATPLLWDLNGTPVDNPSTLRAPLIPGNYKLTVQYFHDGKYNPLSVDFTVNGLPRVTIEKPLANSQAVAGAPVVFTAQVTDDQPYGGTVQWSTEDGTVIAEGNTFVKTDLPVGTHSITASVTDRYGAQAQETVPIQIYTPVSGIATAVNENRQTYIVLAGSMPLSTSATYTGGIAARTTWELKQGETVISKQGNLAYFSYAELLGLKKESVTITCMITDTGINDSTKQEVFRQDHIVQLVGEATALLEQPAPGAAFYLGDPIPIVVSLVGFTRPNFTVTVNGEPFALSWTALEGTLSYGSRIPASALASIGVYDVVLKVTENGFSTDLPFVLNVYQARKGVFIDSPPSHIDLTKDPVEVVATVANLPEVDSIQWFADTAGEPFARGMEALLSSNNLTPGSRTITVEARSGDSIASSTSFTLAATGEMSLTLSPETELLILHRGAPIELTASANDKDGLPIEAGAISWESHLDGYLGSSGTLRFSEYPTISRGEHLLTVTATGKDGTSVSQFQKIQVNAPEDALTGESQEEMEEPEPLYVGDAPFDAFGNPSTFDAGDPIDPYQDPYGSDPFGPGGSQMDPTLGNYMNDYFSDPYGGYGGPDPYGGYGGFGGPDPYGGYGGFGGPDPYGGYGGFGGGYGGPDPFGGWGF